MRILMISSILHPVNFGGYGVSAGEVFQGLSERGHEVSILTSDYSVHSIRKEPGVYRVLRIAMIKHIAFIDFINRAWLTQMGYALWNYAILRRMIKKLRPELILVSDFAALGGLILDDVHRRKIPTVHYIFDERQPDFYDQDIWFSRNAGRAAKSWPRRLAKLICITILKFFLNEKPVPLNLEKSMFGSTYLKERFQERGLAVSKAVVIPHGVDLRKFTPRKADEKSEGILFCSRITPEKGLHIFLDSLWILRNNPAFGQKKITIAGHLHHRSYVAKIKAMVENLKPYYQISLVGFVPWNNVGPIYREHNVFVFPVVWQEPYGIAPLEAMASGLAVVATGTGGGAEYFRDGENCLLTPPGDPEKLAQALERLCGDKTLQEHLVRNALQTAAHFNLETSISQVESHLESVCQG